jgi:hypothetical protein
MAEVLQPYSAQHFNAIPDIHDARDTFAAKAGRAFVDAVFIPLVKKHGLEDKVGLSLLHRHFALEDGENLVELNNISTPWSADNNETSLPVGGQILPTAWLIQDGKFMPYEFYFTPVNCSFSFKSIDLTDPNIRGFLEDFVEAVKDADLDGLVSLRLSPQGNFDKTLEVT